MQKFGRVALVGLVGLFVLAAVVLLGVNLYVQSQGTQARIQQELRQRLGAELRIGRISVTPWGGLKLSGITIPQSADANAGNFLEAESFTLQLRFLSLFSKRLVITEVALVRPKVTWFQNAQGRWRLPTVDEKEFNRAPEGGAIEEAIPPFKPSAESLPSPTPLIAASPITSAPPIHEERRKFVAEVRRFNVRHGNFSFLDRSGKMVAAFDNAGLRSVLRNGVALRGRATVEKISLRDHFLLQQLTTPLRYEAGELELSQIAARAGDGEISGHFLLQSQAEDSPFSVGVKFHNVQADRLITDAGGQPGILQGRLEGNFDATGKTADAAALAGNGEILLRDGQVRQYPLLVALGQMFQIEELTELHLDQASAKYHVSPGVVMLDQLDLRSPNIHLSATGTISFSGKLHLDSRLSIDDKLRSQLYKPIRANFQPTDESGYFGVDFQVTGTVDRPKTNLLEKVVGRDLKDFLNTLWRGKSDHPKKRKSADASATEEAPSPEEKPGTPAPSP